MSENVPAKVQAQQQTPLDALTTMQRLFVEGRLNGLRPQEAAKFAGMSEKSMHVEAYRMDKHPKVIAAIQYVLNSGQDVAVTRDYVLEGFKDAVRAAKDSTELTNAYKEMGRLMGHYAPEKTVNINAEATIDDIRQMSDSELMETPVNTVKPGVSDVLDAEWQEVVAACQPLTDETAND